MCFVTPNFFEVNQICRAWSLEHVSVMIYARTHAEKDDGYTFGRISEAFGSGRTGSVFIKLESGSTLVVQVREGPQSVDVATRFFPF